MVVIVVAILKGSTLNPSKMQHRETVPLNQIHLGEIAHPYKMDSRGTVPVPLLTVLSGWTLKFL